MQIKPRVHLVIFKRLPTHNVAHNAHNQTYMHYQQSTNYSLWPLVITILNSEPAILKFGTKIYLYKKIAFKFRSLKVNFRPCPKSSEDLSFSMNETLKVFRLKKKPNVAETLRYCLFFNFREKITRSKNVVYDLSIILFLLNFLWVRRRTKPEYLRRCVHATSGILFAFRPRVGHKAKTVAEKSTLGILP